MTISNYKHLLTYLLTDVTKTAVTPIELPSTSRLRKLSAETNTRTNRYRHDRNYIHHAATRVVKLHDANWTTGGNGTGIS